MEVLAYALLDLFHASYSVVYPESTFDSFPLS